MFSIKWDAKNRTFFGERNKKSFAVSSIYAMSEMGIYCPLCITDGAATIIDRYCEEPLRSELLTGVASENLDNFLTGAMFLTEKAGGSDVGANLVTAKHIEGKRYALSGEKWFCSNANAAIIFALARTGAIEDGTRSLSLFLIQPKKNPKPLKLIRLKEKLGVRSMASAEIMLDEDEALLIGEENQGFKLMTDMINISRLYNSVAAQSASRRALVEAYQFALNRETFGKQLLSHSLIREKFEEIGALSVANFYLTWNAIDLLDQAEDGNKDAKELIRLTTPMVKKWSAEKGVYIVRESMGIMGGIGYIEDQVMPKIMRDILVLPIWEGAGNIMFLDMLRAVTKSKGLVLMSARISDEISKSSLSDKQGLLCKMKELDSLFKTMITDNTDEMQRKAKYFFEDLTTLYQIAILLKNKDEVSKNWIDPSIHYLTTTLLQKSRLENKQLTDLQVKKLIAWEI
jgi:alkylation response protein AidB-like acyl-CoA dehydrogenase